MLCIGSPALFIFNYSFFIKRYNMPSNQTSAMPPKPPVELSMPKKLWIPYLILLGVTLGAG